MPETTRPCDLHAWQPVLLPDGRAAILCQRCGQHAATLPAEPWPYPIVVSPGDAETAPNILPPIFTPPPIWFVPYWQPYPPLYPSVPPTITDATGVNGAALGVGAPLADTATCMGLCPPLVIS